MEQKFHRSQKILHWVMAPLIIGMIFIGAFMVNSISHWHSVLMTIHKPLGIIILCLVLIRLYFRMRCGVPSQPTNMPLWQKQVANTSHWLLYILILMQPVVGVFMLWVRTIQETHAPHFVYFSWLRDIHSILAYGLFALIVLHITAAFFHHFILGDPIFKRMNFK